MKRPRKRDRLYRALIKPLGDRALASGAVIVLGPVIGAAAGAIFVTMGRPIFFRQARPGRHGEPFVLLKFRTMAEPKEGESRFHSDGARVTPVGAFLRKTSLDELPSLLNVVRGEMSIIGPRPLLMQYLQRYTPEQARRHEVRPGITGWAQVHGRQHLPFSRRLELDTWYVDHLSPSLDLQILLKTLVQAVQGSGVETGQSVAEVDDLGLFQDSDAEPKL